MRSELDLLAESLVYKENFDARPIREQLGLDGAGLCRLSHADKERLATMLLRANRITTEEIESLGGTVRQVSPEEERLSR